MVGLVIFCWFFGLLFFSLFWGFLFGFVLGFLFGFGVCWFCLVWVVCLFVKFYGFSFPPEIHSAGGMRAECCSEVSMPGA